MNSTAGALPQGRNALIGLGSNINPESNLVKAKDLLAQWPGIHPMAFSRLYRTKAWGKTDQDDFLNAVIKLETRLEPLELLGALQQIENMLGRERLEKWGPRTIDLDILDYGGLVLQTDRLVLPHPLLHQRAFVLVPLLGVDPDWRHPISGLPARELLAGLPPEEMEPVEQPDLWD
ncbi:MAG: 2-amino-4-hydroxy-6-hydroxymethyldihydropteridine diphosphokinase [Deltaproteobacteria bacterium]|nr:2-amino-4-hydroxy-6-hydroxymethyldihydropteridine diphosphokinase [Deltaproteobacteria bacterium]